MQNDKRNCFHSNLRSATITQFCINSKDKSEYKSHFMNDDKNIPSNNQKTFINVKNDICIKNNNLLSFALHRPISMPNMLTRSTAALCHCRACCSCSPSGRYCSTTCSSSLNKFSFSEAQSHDKNSPVNKLNLPNDLNNSKSFELNTFANNPNWSPVSPAEFQTKLKVMYQTFKSFNDEQKNLVLKKFMESCEQSQIHFLSVEIGSHLHEGCPINCQDPFTALPQPILHKILTYLDIVSLARASQVNQLWNVSIKMNSKLWHNWCCMDQWRLSPELEESQQLRCRNDDGVINWRQMLVERYRWHKNWMHGRCNVRTFEGHNQGVCCVQFDDTRIVSGSSDKTIKVWNRRTNSPWHVQTLVGHSGSVRCLSLNKNRLVSGSTDCSIKVWDLSSQDTWAIIACKVTMIGHTDTVRCLKVDEEKVISGSYDKTIKVWKMKTGFCLMTLRGHEAAVLCIHFDDNKIVSGSCDKTIKVWGFDGICKMTLEGHQDAVTCLQFDSKRIISGSLDYNLRFWDTATGVCLKIIDWQASEGHTRVVRCLQADNWRVISSSDDKTIKIWSLESGKRLVTLRNHTDGVTCLQFNEQVLISGSYDKSVKLWDFSCC